MTTHLASQPDDDLSLWLQASIDCVQEKKRAKKLNRNKMNTALAKNEAGAMLERVVIHGDLSRLSPQERTSYYGQVCQSLGLNPLTRPFEYLRLNGKEILYAKRDCTDQLRQIHSVSVVIASRERIDELLVVTARATLPNGRTDESTGAVAIGSLKGEALANAMMKAETKAKRRVTLSICGLAMLDESEIDSVPHVEITPHAAPDEDAQESSKPSAEFDEMMGDLRAMDQEVFDPGCTWHSMNAIRGKLGRKGSPTPFSSKLSQLYQTSSIAPSQRKDLAALWNRVDRKLTALEGKLKPPSVESSFVDDPADDADAFGPEPAE